MSGTTIVIALGAQPGTQRDLTHRFRNFGEAVFRWLRDNKGAGVVDFDEIDSSIDTLAISDVKASMCRRVMLWVGKEAQRQHLTISLDTRHQ